MTTNPIPEPSDELVLKVAKEVERVFYEAVDRGDMRGPQAFEHAARAAIAAMPELTVQGWQPIATAPKETCILVSNGHVVGEAEKVRGKWIQSSCDDRPFDNEFGSYFELPIGPTHWMPLPSPPVESSNG